MKHSPPDGAPGRDLLRVWLSQRDGVACVAVRGEIDVSNSDRFAQTLLEALEWADAAVEVDLAGVGFMGTVGIGALSDAAGVAERAGRKLRLGRVSSPVARLLELAGLGSWLHADSLPASPQPLGHG